MSVGLDAPQRKTNGFLFVCLFWVCFLDISHR